MIQWDKKWRGRNCKTLESTGLLNTGLRHRGGLGVDGTVLDGDGIHTNVCLDQNLWNYR